MAHGITEAQVHAAADTLVERGDRPTVERIRAHLGTGSPNTVTRYLESWWGGLGVRLAAWRKGAAIPEAPAEVVDLASRWWEAALSASRSHMESEMASERASIASARATLADDAQALQSRLEDGLAAASQADQARLLAEQRLEDLTGVATELRLQLTRATTSLDAAEARANRLQDELTAHIQQLQTRESHFSEERRLQTEHLREVENRAHTEIDRARQEARELKRLVGTATREKQALDKSYRELQETMHRQLADAQREAAVARAEANALLVTRQSETIKPRKKTKAGPKSKRTTHSPRTPKAKAD